MTTIRLGAIVLALATALTRPAFAQEEGAFDAPPEGPAAAEAPEKAAAPTPPVAATPPAAPAPSDGKFTFFAPERIEADTLKCFTTAKAAATRDAQRAGRNKCLADKRREHSSYRKAVAAFKAEVATFKAKLTTIPAGCRLTYAQGFQRWVTDFMRYSKSGGERVAVAPPAPSSHCK